MRKSESGFIFAAATLLIWAGFPVVSRLGGQGVLNPFDILALRVGVASLVLAPWWLPRLFDSSRRKLKFHQSLTFALLAGLLYPLLAYWGLRHAPANHGAVLIVGMLPIFTAALAHWFLAEVPSWLTRISLSFVGIGVSVLFVSGWLVHGFNTEVFGGDIILCGASLVWAVFTVLLKRWGCRAFDVTLGIVAVSSLIYLPAYFVFLPKNIGSAPLSQILIQGLFQGIVVPCVAMFTYAKAIEQLGAFRTVIILSATPLVGTLMATAVLHETLQLGSALAATVVFVGSVIGASAAQGGQTKGTA